MKWLNRKLQEKQTGTAASKDAPPVATSAPGIEEQPQSSFGMSVMAGMVQGESETSQPLLSFSTPAADTGSSGLNSTGWMLTTAEILERDPAFLDKLPLVTLSPLSHKRLEALSAGRCEPVGNTIREIAIALSEEESDLMERPLIEAVEYYLSSY